MARVMSAGAAAWAASVALLLAAGASAAQAAAPTYENPIIPKQNLPDPGVLRHKDGSYLVATTGGCGRHGAFPLHVAPATLAVWSAASPRGCVFHNTSAHPWGRQDFWAPEVHAVGSGFNVYYTARGHDGVLAVGVAAAATADGPFVDSGRPLVHNGTMGSIDPNHFVDDDGSQYLLWKTDGNAVGQHTPIHIAPLDATGTKLVGPSTVLITNTFAWEGPLVEAPWLMKVHGKYVLFYSGNIMAKYAVGAAHASSIRGPYTKQRQPVISAGMQAGKHWVGPGHCSVVTSPNGEYVMFYHAWVNTGKPVNFGDERLLMMDALSFSNGAATMSAAAPTHAQLPIP